MQRAHRKAHRAVWLVLPLALLVVLVGALWLRQARIASRAATPAGVQVAPPAIGPAGERK